MMQVSVVIIASMLLAGGCASAARSPSVPSTALAAAPTTALGRELEPVVQQHVGESGFI